MRVEKKREVPYIAGVQGEAFRVYAVCFCSMLTRGSALALLGFKLIVQFTIRSSRFKLL